MCHEMWGRQGSSTNHFYVQIKDVKQSDGISFHFMRKKSEVTKSFPQRRLQTKK